mgnify:CR=1 FL=1
MHVAITGNIGAGKTTLATLLSKHYEWEVLYEAVEGNPYLSDFYGDMERWAFNLQMFFLKSRFEQVLQIQESNKRYIQDRTIYEDAFIFAKNLNMYSKEEAKIIRQARLTNDAKPHYVIDQIEKAADEFKRPVIACLGSTAKS